MADEHASDAAVPGEKMAGAAAKKDKGSRTNGFNQLRYIQQMGWTPTVSLVEQARSAKKSSDEALATWMLENLLAIPVTMDMVREPLTFLRQEREKAGLADGHLLDDAKRAEPALRELAHLILSLPEAQLN